MPRRCERPGCSAPAEVAYGFDIDQVIVWLDAVDPDAAERINAGVLCRRHADALQPPRGWFLDDRRDPRPRLFRPVEDATPPGGRPCAGERRRRRPRPLDTTEELPLFAEAAEIASFPVGAAQVEQVELVVSADDRRRRQELEDTEALPWTPVFDHADDLGGVLNARSPLLARAFGNRGRPR